MSSLRPQRGNPKRLEDMTLAEVHALAHKQHESRPWLREQRQILTAIQTQYHARDDWGGSLRTRALLHSAREINARRDQGEREAGFAAPGDDGSIALWLRTAIQALVAGLESNDLTCIAEGVAMLEQIEWVVRQCEPGQTVPL